MPPFPIDRYLLPRARRARPTGFTEAAAERSPPACRTASSSAPAYHAVLVLPTGLARQWLHTDPLAVVSTSADDLAPRPAPRPAPAPGAGGRAPLRLVVRAGHPECSARCRSSPGCAGSCPDAGRRRQGSPSRSRWWCVAGSCTPGRYAGPATTARSSTLGWRRADLAADRSARHRSNRFVLASPPDRSASSPTSGRRPAARPLPARQASYGGCCDDDAVPAGQVRPGRGRQRRRLDADVSTAETPTAAQPGTAELELSSDRLLRVHRRRAARRARAAARTGSPIEGLIDDALRADAHRQRDAAAAGGKLLPVLARRQQRPLALPHEPGRRQRRATPAEQLDAGAGRGAAGHEGAPGAGERDLRHRAARLVEAGLRPARCERVRRALRGGDLHGRDPRRSGRAPESTFATWGDEPGRHDDQGRGEAAGEESVDVRRGAALPAALERMAARSSSRSTLYGAGHGADPRRHRAPRQAADPVPGGRAQAAHARDRTAQPAPSTAQDESDPFAASRGRRQAAAPRASAWTPDAQGPSGPEARRRRALRAARPVDGPRRWRSLGAALAGSFAAPFCPVDAAELGKRGEAARTSASAAHAVAHGRVRHASCRASRSTARATRRGRRGVDCLRAARRAGAGRRATRRGAAEAVRRAARAAHGETRGSRSARSGRRPPTRAARSSRRRRPRRCGRGWSARTGARTGPPPAGTPRTNPSPLPGVTLPFPVRVGATGSSCPATRDPRRAGYRNGAPTTQSTSARCGRRARVRSPSRATGGSRCRSASPPPSARRSARARRRPTTTGHGHARPDRRRRQPRDRGRRADRAGGQEQPEAAGSARRAEKGTITIEHAGRRASIVMRQDGTITITATQIDLDAATAR